MPNGTGTDARWPVVVAAALVGGAVGGAVGGYVGAQAGSNSDGNNASGALQQQEQVQNQDAKAHV
jgi:hypothetical protein